MIMKKRGLSDVVTTGLVILLAIAAVVIVWTFVKPTIIGVGEKVISGGDCLSLVFTPLSCTATEVRVRREAGEGDLGNIKLVFYDATGDSAVFASGQVLNPLESATIDYSGASLAITPTKVKVAGVVQGKTCPESSVEVACA